MDFQHTIWFKNLNVIIDPELISKEHISHLTTNLNKFCGVSYKIRYIFSKEHLLLFLFNSHSKSIIKYGIIMYDSSAKTELEKNDMFRIRIYRLNCF